MTEVSVNLEERSYVITVGRGSLSRLGSIVAAVRKPSAVAVVTNPVVAGHYAQAARESLSATGVRTELIVLPAGERFKTLATVRRVYDALTQMRMDRGGAIVALGGGVIGDLAGFAAATYMRGIDYYQVPTTLLAQVDSSVGGKTGVDLPQGKNLVGAFHQPRAVVIDTATLDTLPVRELRSGLAEVVKHGIIYDQGFFEFLGTHARDLLARGPDAIEHAVVRSVEIKRDVVQTDERESGLRAILNCGHTIGHAVEMLAGYGRYRHGEAVSIGLVAEALLAEQQGIAGEPISARIEAALGKFRLPVHVGLPIPTADIVRAAELDKKVLSAELRLALPVAVGRCEVHTVSREMLTRAIDALREREAGGEA